MVMITPSYHRERAIEHYRQAIEAHREGRAYKEIVEHMYYMDDDFNDNLTHFAVALERFRRNGGHFEERISKLTQKLENTQVHDWKRYFYGPPRDRAGQNV